MEDENTPPEGLRTRKKRRTRRALTVAAFRLFREKGYDQTTVAEIAAEAEVATKTFFNYFPSKEDVVFADAQDRLELALQEIGDRQTTEGPVELMRHTVEQTMMALLSDDTDIDRDLLPYWIQLISTVPALQARGLQISFETERRVTRALHEAYPQRLDRVTAAIVVGAALGAAQAALGESLERGDSLDRTKEVLEQALDIAVHGIRHAVADRQPELPR